MKKNYPLGIAFNLFPSSTRSTSRLSIVICNPLKEDKIKFFYYKMKKKLKLSNTKCKASIICCLIRYEGKLNNNKLAIDSFVFN